MRPACACLLLPLFACGPKAALAEQGQAQGIGLDEGAALVVEAGRFRYSFGEQPEKRAEVFAKELSTLADELDGLEAEALWSLPLLAGTSQSGRHRHARSSELHPAPRARLCVALVCAKRAAFLERRGRGALGRQGALPR